MGQYHRYRIGGPHMKDRHLWYVKYGVLLTRALSGGQKPQGLRALVLRFLQPRPSEVKGARAATLPKLGGADFQDATKGGLTVGASL